MNILKYCGVVCIYCIILLLNNIPTLMLMNVLGIEGDSYTVYLLYALLLLAYVTVYLLLSEKKRVFFVAKRHIRSDIAVSSLLLIGESIALFIISVSENEKKAVTADKGKILVMVLVVLFMACAEEFVFRGLCRAWLRKYEKGLLRTIGVAILSGICFGLMHIVNLVNAGAELSYVVFQICCAFAMGVFYYSVLLSTENIYVTIFLHFMYNVALIIPDALFDSERVNMVESGAYTGITTLSVVHCMLAVVFALVHIILSEKNRKK